MFFLIKLIRKIFKQIKSTMTPAQIGVGVFLGVLMGLTPFGLHWTLLFFLALLFNCSMGAYLLSWGLSKLIFLAVAPLAFRVGTSLLAEPGWAQSLAQTLSEAPILAFMGYERYLVFGAYVIGIPAALVLAVLVGLTVNQYRGRVAQKIGEKSWYQKMMKVGVLRFTWNFFFGKDVDQPTKKRFILLRPFRAYMVAAIPLLIVATVVGAGIWAQWAVGGLAAGMISRSLGVKCTFDEVAYAFFGQEFSFKQFQLPDPSATDQNMVQIGKFEADLGFVELLSKRIHIENLSVSDVSWNVARDEDGKLNVTQLPAAQPDPNAGPEEKAAWQEYLEWLEEKGKDVDWAEVYRKYMEYRRKKAEEEERIEKGEQEPVEVVLEYDPDARWVPKTRMPFFRVDRIAVENFSLNVAEAGGSLPSLTQVSGQGTHISTIPGWDSQPMALKGEGKLNDGKSGQIRFTISYLPGNASADIGLSSVPLTELKPLYEDSLPVNVEAGTVTVGTKGTMREGVIDSSAGLRIDQLKVAEKAGAPPLFGMSPEHSGYIIQGINAYGEELPIEADVAVVGPADDPEVKGGVPFLEIAKEGLKRLGKKEFDKVIAAIDGQLTEMKAEAEKVAEKAKSEALEAGAKSVEALKKGDVKGAQEELLKKKDGVKAEDLKNIKEKPADLKKVGEDLKKKLPGGLFGGKDDE